MLNAEQYDPTCQFKILNEWLILYSVLGNECWNSQNWSSFYSVPGDEHLPDSKGLGIDIDLTLIQHFHLGLVWIQDRFKGHCYARPNSISKSQCGDFRLGHRGICSEPSDPTVILSKCSRGDHPLHCCIKDRRYFMPCRGDLGFFLSEVIQPGLLGWCKGQVSYKDTVSPVSPPSQKLPHTDMIRFWCWNGPLVCYRFHAGHYSDELVQKSWNSSTYVLELHQFYTNVLSVVGSWYSQSRIVVQGIDQGASCPLSFNMHQLTYYYYSTVLL